MLITQRLNSKTVLHKWLPDHTLLYLNGKVVKRFNSWNDMWDYWSQSKRSKLVYRDEHTQYTRTLRKPC